MKFLKPILSHGAPTIALFFGLVLCLLALGANFLFPEFIRDIDNHTISIHGSIGADGDNTFVGEGRLNTGRLNTAIKMIGLSLLASILYLRLRDGSSRTAGEEFNRTGVIGVLDHLNAGALLEDMMSKPGNKYILSTWIYNLSGLERPLKFALKHAETQVNFVVLKPDSEYALGRARELNVEKDRPRSCLNQIASFYDSLPDEQRKRVHVYVFDDMPKVSIYACGDRALVGMFLPGKNSITAPHFVIEGCKTVMESCQTVNEKPQSVIEGHEGKFSASIWEYYTNLKKEDITDTLLSMTKAERSTS